MCLITLRLRRSWKLQVLILLSPFKIVHLLIDSICASGVRQSAERLRSWTLALLHNSFFNDSYLLEWLDALMLGHDFESIVHQLVESSKPSVCAKMFSSGEAAYQCRTCGVDPTCIQCTACFKLSNHKGHDIKMTTAGGGGICDCGDSSSWDPKGNCSKHSGASDGSDPLLSLSADAQFAAPIVMDALITVLGWTISHRNNCWSVPDCGVQWAPPSATDNSANIFFVAMLNDEAHGFDEVVSQVQASICCDKKQAMQLAVRVDQLKRSVLSPRTRAPVQFMCAT
jgi:E3 ubiquitin-protein ligase UBR2